MWVVCCLLGLPWVAHRRVDSYHQVAFLHLFARGNAFFSFRVRIEEYGRLCGCKLFFAGDGCDLLYMGSVHSAILTGKEAGQAASRAVAGKQQL